MTQLQRDESGIVHIQLRGSWDDGVSWIHRVHRQLPRHCFSVSPQTTIFQQQIHLQLRSPHFQFSSRGWLRYHSSLFHSFPFSHNHMDLVLKWMSLNSNPLTYRDDCFFFRLFFTSTVYVPILLSIHVITQMEGNGVLFLKVRFSFVTQLIVYPCTVCSFLSLDGKYNAWCKLYSLKCSCTHQLVYTLGGFIAHSLVWISDSWIN